MTAPMLTPTPTHGGQAGNVGAVRVPLQGCVLRHARAGTTYGTAAPTRSAPHPLEVGRSTYVNASLVGSSCPQSARPTLIVGPIVHVPSKGAMVDHGAPKVMTRLPGSGGAATIKPYPSV